MTRPADGTGTRTIRLGEVEVALAEPMELPGPVRREILRGQLLERCRCAWGVVPGTEGGSRFAASPRPLPFRLEGPPGSGKNVLVYQLARELGRELYVQSGHEDLTPEDLSLLVTPIAGPPGLLPLRLRASPLATALICGGLFLFDDIHRVPERALAALAPVLDGRHELYSAATGLWIHPLDEEAGRSFRFCCIAAGDGAGSLPAFIEQRTAPVIRVAMPTAGEMEEMLNWSVASPREDLEPFREAQDRRRKDESQALAVRLGSGLRHALLDIQHRDVARRFELSREIAGAGQWDRAATIFEAIASELPANDELGMCAGNNRAHCLMELGRLREADEICAELLERDPRFGYAQCTRGDVHAALRRGAAERDRRRLKKSACDHIRRALDLAGSDSSLRQYAERRLAELRCAARKRPGQETQR